MVFAESSNIGTAQIALRAGPTRQQTFLRQARACSDGLKTELPEMASPLYPRRWNEVETVTISYGQGISVNPLALRRRGCGRGERRNADPSDLSEA